MQSENYLRSEKFCIIINHDLKIFTPHILHRTDHTILIRNGFLGPNKKIEKLLIQSLMTVLYCSILSMFMVWMIFQNLGKHHHSYSNSFHFFLYFFLPNIVHLRPGTYVVCLLNACLEICCVQIVRK